MRDSLTVLAPLWYSMPREQIIKLYDKNSTRVLSDFKARGDSTVLSSVYERPGGINNTDVFSFKLKRPVCREILK